MPKCVQIEQDDDGNFTVGLKPYDSEDAADGGADEATEGDASAAGGDAGGQGAPAGAEGSPDEEAAEQSYMKPARDINDALRQAKQLLEQPASTDGGPDPFESGFADARGMPLGAGGQ